MGHFTRGKNPKEYQTRQIKLKSQPRHRKRVKVAPEAINAHARQFGPEAVLCIVVSAFFFPPSLPAIEPRVPWFSADDKSRSEASPIVSFIFVTSKWPRHRGLRLLQVQYLHFKTKTLQSFSPRKLSPLILLLWVLLNLFLLLLLLLRFTSRLRAFSALSLLLKCFVSIIVSEHLSFTVIVFSVTECYCSCCCHVHEHG